MKRNLFVILLCTVLIPALNGQGSGSAVTDLLLSAYSERNYTTEPVTDVQLETILKCGIASPSARNFQPWRFTVVRDETLMKEIVKDAVAGNVLIIISGSESQELGVVTDFNCGLATQNMFIAAHGLGLGARIYGSPIATVTSKREQFQIPAGFKPVIVLRVGNTQRTTDAVSAASARKKAEELVNYIK